MPQPFAPILLAVAVLVAGYVALMHTEDTHPDW
jgi:hypothetical protein